MSAASRRTRSLVMNSCATAYIRGMPSSCAVIRKLDQLAVEAAAALHGSVVFIAQRSSCPTSTPPHKTMTARQPLNCVTAVFVTFLSFNCSSKRTASAPRVVPP